MKCLAPSDLVECPAKKHCVRRMWRGQISRVAGYEDDQEELPAGYCTVSWLGEKLHQSQPQQIKATGLRLLDRPFVVGDRVSSQEDAPCWASESFLVRIPSRWGWWWRLEPPYDVSYQSILCL